jgi:hypothetical protein
MVYNTENKSVFKKFCLKSGTKLSFKAHKLGPWFSNWGKNMFPRKPHTEESKIKI